MINLETLVRPAILKMMGVSLLGHPTVEAFSDDSIPGIKPMAFVKWTNLYRENGEYHVRLNDFDNRGVLESMSKANSLTIIPERTAVNQGDKIKVLVFDWCRELDPSL
jgi:molybdopterin biosynthesis enzyme